MLTQSPAHLTICACLTSYCLNQGTIPITWVGPTSVKKAQVILDLNDELSRKPWLSWRRPQLCLKAARTRLSAIHPNPEEPSPLRKYLVNNSMAPWEEPSIQENRLGGT